MERSLRGDSCELRDQGSGFDVLLVEISGVSFCRYVLGDENPGMLQGWMRA